MLDPFSACLGVFFRGPGSVEARYRPEGQDPRPDPVRVIRSLADGQVRFGEGSIIQGTNVFEIQRSDVEEPRDGDELTIAGVTYRLEGDGMLDLEGLTWTIGGSVA